ncbi:MAG: hypothetical protein KDC80_22575 [Saprospiraceae bacterium]|nr:hypothetical protein [Saprospiraceae bacterium]
MKPKQASIPFFKLLLRDRKNLFKSTLNYTKEADRRLYFMRKYGDLALPTVDLSELLDGEISISNYTYLDGVSRPTDIALIMSLCRK